MARGNGFTAAALNINIGANSAQLSAAVDKAKAIVQNFTQQSSVNLQKLAGAFKTVGGAAMSVGGVVANAAGSVARSTAWAVTGLSVYTGAIVANRLEQLKLAKQFNLTEEQMNSLAYMAKYAGQETEDFADALKELSIKAGDAVEGGEKMADTMGVLFDKMGGAKKWVGENDPIKKILALREAFQQLSLADQVRVADEMGDAGLKLISTLKLTNAEFELLRKTGAATGAAMNTEAIQTLISKFGVLHQVGNDFLTSIVARFAPMFSMVCDDWTKKLYDTLQGKGKGSMEDGFQAYVDEWSDKIFNFLMDTIKSVASFVDGLNSTINMLQSVTNSVKGAAGGTISKQYDADFAGTISPQDKESETKYDELMKSIDERADQINAYIARKKAEGAKKGTNWLVQTWDEQTDSKYMDMKNELNILRDQKAQYEGTRIALNAEYNAKRDKDKFYNKAVVLEGQAREKYEEIKNKPKDKPVDNPNKPKNTPLSEQVFNNSQVDANKAKTDALAASTAALDQKLIAQQKKIQSIRDKFQFEQRAEWDRTVNAEKQELSDAFVDAEQIINDHYADRLKTVKAGSAEELRLQREMNDKKMDVQLIQAEAEKQLLEDQRKRRALESAELMKDMIEQHEDVMKKLGKRGVGGIQGGTVGKQNQIREQTKAVEEQYDAQLKTIKDKYGEESTEYKDMLDKKLEALKEYHAKEAAMIAAQGEGVGHDARRLWGMAFGGKSLEESFSERESVVQGYTNAEIGMMKSHSDEVVGNDANAIAQRKQMDEDAQNARMMFMADGLSQVTAMGAKNNKALFIAQKAITLAMIAMNTMMGASQAMKLGPEGLPMVPMFYAMGAAQAAQVLATTFIQGQAHDGIDYIPADGTWNLQKGERIVDNRLNVELKQATKKINDGNYAASKGTFSISAPLTIQGDVVDNGWFSTKLDEHYDRIAECVAKYNDDRGVNT